MRERDKKNLHGEYRDEENMVGDRDGKDRDGENKTMGI